ncbi:LysE family translocator [Staphylococcus pseudoxylosus]|uniref:LysE family translocator n=1 Tax=Staphylococcus pseudoxylosus TaxID=2282419 RepID=UPI00398A5B7D
MTSFLIYIIVTSITPGPSNLFILNSTKKYGFIGASKFILGILFSFLMLAIIAVIILFTFETSINKIEVILKYFGFVYLLYLAYKTYNSKKRNNSNDAYYTFSQGLIMQLLNVKSLLFFITLLGAFILPVANDYYMVFLYMLITVLVGWSALLIWGVIGDVLKNFLDKHSFVFNLTMSLLLVYAALSIFM